MNELTITVDLSVCDAWAFAQFLKRVGVDDYRQLAADPGEANEMISAGERIRSALAGIGIVPR